MYSRGVGVTSHEVLCASHLISWLKKYEDLGLQASHFLLGMILAEQTQPRQKERFFGIQPGTEQIQKLNITLVICNGPN